MLSEVQPPNGLILGQVFTPLTDHCVQGIEAKEEDSNTFQDIWIREKEVSSTEGR